MPPQLRDHFLLDRDCHFLNHGSFGACPIPVFEAYQYWQRELERQPVHFMLRRLPALLESPRERLANHLQAAPENLIFATNATSALNLVIRSIDWRAGDEIITSNQEYGALLQTWQFVCERSGANLRQLEIGPILRDEDEFADAFWQHLSAKTRAIFISHITSPTAQLFPIRALVQRARQAGILTIIDGAHTPGQIPLNLRALAADAYAGNGHKWLLAPKGAAFLHIQPELQESMVPLVISHGWLADASFTSQNTWYGTQDFAAYLSIPAALDFIAAHDWDEVCQHCREEAGIIRKHLAARGFPPIDALNRPQELQMFSVQLPSCDIAATYRRLWEEFRVEAPIFPWLNTRLLRVSWQGYNAESDWHALVAALQALFPNPQPTNMPAPP